MKIVVAAVLAVLAFAQASAEALTFEDRVEYQRRIEEVYWKHRIWPKENPTPKPPLSSVLTDAAIREKVEDTLRKSNALESFWGHPVTSTDLQAELDRMVRDSRDPAMLAELFRALGDDPFVIAETLVRHTLADRLIRNWYAYDTRFHGDVKHRAEVARAAARTPTDARSSGGDYRETTFARASGSTLSPERIVELDAKEWDEHRAALARRFPGETVRPGRLSDLEETADGFSFVALVEDHQDRIKLATVTWAKTPFEDWWSRQRDAHTAEVDATWAAYALTTPRSVPCTDDAWRSVYTGTPDRRELHTAVWTGTEMIVWGGHDLSFVYRSGGRYQPSTDTWVATTLIGAPTARVFHTAVWTGTETIVWGGSPTWGGGPPLNTGGRYDPVADAWSPTSVGSGVPVARERHTAVWTGTEMIVWGGNGGGTSGGRYVPSSDSWSGTSLVNAPTTRWEHTAVWTGSEMIVWGGGQDSPGMHTGGRYSPSSDSWVATSTFDAPTARVRQTAVWTGSEMIVWGGSAHSFSSTGLDSGGRYAPGSDSWTTTSTATGTPAPRDRHSAVWTGSRMLVWGGQHFDQVTGPTLHNTGGAYEPATDQWTATSTGASVPTRRYGHSAVWTGQEMIVWGGAVDFGSASSDTGGRYNPGTATWLPTSTMSAPTERASHVSVWTGSEMIIWGGLSSSQTISNVGGRYDPATDTWTTTVPFLEQREKPAAVWTGTEMIVWGGIFASSGAGARYNPATNTATPTTTTGAPTERYYHSAVWTGTQMIVWGGDSAGSGALNSGGRYSPSSNTWVATSTTGAPTARVAHTAVWTGGRMIVWGGGVFGQAGAFDTGGQYDAVLNTWSATTTIGAPSARFFQSGVWTGDEMIIWGGGGATAGTTGGRYSPTSDTWTPTSEGANVPGARQSAATIWTGGQMVVWGGRDNFGGAPFDTGARYIAASDTWVPMSPGPNLPSARFAPTAEWTGSEMIVWGGMPLNQEAGRYCVGCVADAECSDGNPCTNDVCNPDRTCSNSIVAAGTSCDDGLYCNGADTCDVAGFCVHAGDPCTADCIDCAELNDACVPSPAAVPCGNPSSTTCSGPDTCNGAGVCLPNHAANGTACLSACSCNDGVCAGPLWFHLTSGTSGTLIGGQSFNETRGIDVTLLAGTGNQTVEALTLNGLTVGVSSATVGARIYDTATTALLASVRTTVSAGSNQSVRVPITASLVAGASYRLAFYIKEGAGVSASLFDPAPPSSGGFPYFEPMLIFRINQAYSTSTDTFPSGANIFAPQISVESYRAEINNGQDEQCAGQPGFGEIDEISGSTGFNIPSNKTTLSWPAQTGAVSYDVARAESGSYAQGCTIFGVPTNSFVDLTLPAASRALFYLVRSATPNVGSWGTASSGAESSVPCAP